MTPATIAGMCKLSGLDAAALTDHNTCGNCAAFCQAAEAYGLLALPGMELCTREEVHIVCVFPDLERAGAFQEEVYRSLGEARNDPAIFGRQLYLDADDRVLGEEPRLLAGRPPSASTRCPPWWSGTAGRPGPPISTGRPSRSCPIWACGTRDWAFPWPRCPGTAPLTLCRAGGTCGACLPSRAVTPTIWSRSQMPGRLWRSPPGPGRQCWPGCAGAARERTGSAARKARPRLAVPVRNRGSYGNRCTQRWVHLFCR